MEKAVTFDELALLSKIKTKPGLYFGRPSLKSLRDMLGGMSYAFSVCGQPDALFYFSHFTKWYNAQLMEKDKNGYACWWNYILYISGGFDDQAFFNFFRAFEKYLMDVHKLTLPPSDH